MWCGSARTARCTVCSTNFMCPPFLPQDEAKPAIPQKIFLGWGTKYSVAHHVFGLNLGICVVSAFTGRRCSLVFRVPGCRARGLRFESRWYKVFLTCGGSCTECTQPRGHNWEVTWMKILKLLWRKQRLTDVENRCVDHATSLYRRRHYLRQPRRSSGGIVSLTQNFLSVSLYLVAEKYRWIMIMNEFFWDVKSCDYC